MGFIEGEARKQGALFPATLDDLIPGDHVCRVIEAFVERLEMSSWDLCALRRLRPGVQATIRAIC